MRPAKNRRTVTSRISNLESASAGFFAIQSGSFGSSDRGGITTCSSKSVCRHANQPLVSMWRATRRTFFTPEQTLLTV